MDGIKEIADSFGAELKHRLPKQRKTQRTKLALLARLRGLDHFRGFGPLKINELIKKVFTTAGAGARAAEWSLGRDLGIADQRESAEGACERQSDTFRLSWQ